MKNDTIKIRGARVHNLQNVDVDIPIGKITCVSGPSGSGKSSLAFHTLFGESKRRYLNSFPTYMKFFSDRPPAADVDSITPVLPAFGLHQVNPVIGARSTVVDAMGVTPLLQNLFYRFSQKICPEHKVKLIEGSIEKGLLSFMESSEAKRFYLFIEKGKYLESHSSLNLPSYSFRDSGERDLFQEEDSFWEISRFSRKSQTAALEVLKSFSETGVRDFFILESGISHELVPIKFHFNYHCPQSPKCPQELSKNKTLSIFSPYNALGACHECSGYGANLEYDYHKFYNVELSLNEGAISFLRHKRFMHFEDELLLEAKNLGLSLDKPLSKLPKSFFQILHHGGDDFCGLDRMITYLEKKKYKPHVRMLIRSLQKEVICPSCDGTRVNPIVEYFGIDKKNIKEIIQSNISELQTKLKKTKFQETTDLLKIVNLAVELGLGHLHLLRKTKTLSAGEYQRLLMMKYLSFEGTSSLFVFDEPSLGLSVKEQKYLVDGFQSLVAQGNTVVLVDHSEFLKKSSDHVIEMGPGAGNQGGQVIAEQTGSKTKSMFKIQYPKLVSIKETKKHKNGFLGIKAPNVYGKTFQDIFIPYNKVSLIKGASGSGKTAVLTHALANAIKKHMGEKPVSKQEFNYEKLYLPQELKDVSVIDANLNRYTSRSSVGSMTGFAGIVRKHFSRTSQAKSMGLKEGHFSSNSQLGQCSICEGKGILVVEMQFLEDVVMPCEHCDGRRLEPRYAQVSDGKLEAWEAYHQPFLQVVEQFKLTPKYKNLWEYMKLLNVEYLALERTMMSLSGGERQRLYLLSKMATKLENQLLIFENLSFGLSSKEIQGVGELLHQLTAQNNTIVLIDQNPLFEGFAHYKVNF